MKFDLSFDNNLKAMATVEPFVQHALTQWPLSETELSELRQFVIAATNCSIETAYPAGELGRIALAIEESHGKLDIQIRDFGLPRVAAPLPQQQVPSCIDEVHWLEFGPEGKALQVIKWLHQTHVADALQKEASPALSQTAPLAPPQQYAVRRIEPSEAIQISQLMYRTYGNTYFNEDVYYPERIAAQNHRGELISVVAVGQDGNVAAHCALERNQNGPVAEIGQAAVDPAHRGRGLLDRMKQVLEEAARELRLSGWFADAVTVHTFTQQSDAHHGGQVCGVDLAVSPQSEAFRGIASRLQQRVSCVLYYRGLESMQPRTCYVPVRHREMVEAIYGNLKCPIDFGKPAATMNAHGAFRVQFAHRAGLATIQVESLGSDSARSLKHAMRALVEKSHAEVVSVELPLADPAAIETCEALEGAGFGFTGVGPCFSSRGDVLKLAYLVEPLAREPIHTFEPFAAQIVDYALAEQRRVRASL